MNKFIGLLITLIGFAATSLLAQSPSPAANAEPSASVAKPKHSKKKAATPATTAATSPAPAAVSPPTPSTPKHKKKDTTPAAATVATSPPPAAVSPTPAKHSWFKSNTPAPTPVAAPATAPSKVPSTTRTTAPATAVPAPGAAPGMVWVNTETHVYHKEGTRWYGKTKKGKYMTEQDAMKEGDRPVKEEAKKTP